jgi:hypothetical protein
MVVGGPCPSGTAAAVAKTRVARRRAACWRPKVDNAGLVRES